MNDQSEQNAQIKVFSYQCQFLWKSSFRERVAMDFDLECPVWYLVKLDDCNEHDFAIQYEGPDPETEFPFDLTGQFPMPR